eukprot:gene13647-19530_t
MSWGNNGVEALAKLAKLELQLSLEQLAALMLGCPEELVNSGVGGAGQAAATAKPEATGSSEGRLAAREQAQTAAHSEAAQSRDGLLGGLACRHPCSQLAWLVGPKTSRAQSHSLSITQSPSQAGWLQGNKHRQQHIRKRLRAETASSEAWLVDTLAASWLGLLAQRRVELILVVSQSLSRPVRPAGCKGTSTDSSTYGSGSEPRQPPRRLGLLTPLQPAGLACWPRDK